MKFFKNGPIPASFVYFRPFLIFVNIGNTTNQKISID